MVVTEYMEVARDGGKGDMGSMTLNLYPFSRERVMRMVDLVDGSMEIPVSIRDFLVTSSRSLLSIHF
jgi:hypothetical protein